MFRHITEEEQDINDKLIEEWWNNLTPHDKERVFTLIRSAIDLSYSKDLIKALNIHKEGRAEFYKKLFSFKMNDNATVTVSPPLEENTKCMHVGKDDWCKEFDEQCYEGRADRCNSYELSQEKLYVDDEINSKDKQ